MYKLQPLQNGKQLSVTRLIDGACIPFDPANVDFANFKKQINADEAQLEDADGNEMTAEQAKEFVSTLP